MNKTAQRVIRALGGVYATARFFGIRPPSVSKWQKAGLPRARERHLRDVRPDLFRDVA